MKAKVAALLSLIALWPCYSTPALAGGRFFFGIGSGHHLFPGASFSFHHHRSRGRDHFFLQFGHQPFGHRGAHPGWGYSYPFPAGTSFPQYPRGMPQRNYSGTDANGALYVDGYRVMPSGWLRIHVEPADAQVLVDGFPVGIDSNSGVSKNIGLTVGKHLIEVRKEGFQPHQAEVEVAQARETLFRVQLNP